jgi:mitogen-activated protein kinase kinase kinase 13
MDVSETDASPSPNCATKRFSGSLQGSNDQFETVRQNIKSSDSEGQYNQFVPNTLQSEDDGDQPDENEDNGNSISILTMTNSRDSDMLTNSKVFDRDDEHALSCPSPDRQQLADLNSNEQLDKHECSDDDNLNILKKKVSEIITENKLTIQQTVNEAQQINDTLNDNLIVYKHNKKLRMCDSDLVLIKNSGAGQQFNIGGSGAVGVYMVSGIESREGESHEDEWTDDEGGVEEINYSSYSLRRKW